LNESRHQAHPVTKPLHPVVESPHRGTNHQLPATLLDVAVIRNSPHHWALQQSSGKLTFCGCEDEFAAPLGLAHCSNLLNPHL
jgi:hypothetical protein